MFPTTSSSPASGGSPPASEPPSSGPTSASGGTAVTSRAGRSSGPRTAPQGHPAYRRVCQAMHRLIAEQAGHRALAQAMAFVDHSAVELERLTAERRSEQKRRERDGDR